MNGEFIYINNQEEYPLNSRYSNLYYSDKKFHTQNNFYINKDININSINDDDFPKSNSKMNNIYIFKSPNKKNKDNDILSRNETNRLQKENISLISSLKKAEKESKLKDAEINIYKQKMKALFKQVNDKNDMLYKKNNLILQLYEEQEAQMNQGQNLNEVENAIRLSNDKINKYKNKNRELIYKITEQNKYIKSISNEKVQLKKYISKIKRDYNKIKEHSAEKDNQIKSLFNFFKRRRNNSSKDNIANTNTQTYPNSNNKLVNIILNSSNNLTEINLTTASNNQMNNQISNLKKCNNNKNIESNFDDKLDIYKCNFTIESKNKKDNNEYNNYLNPNNSLEIQINENEEIISKLKEEVNNLKNELNNCNLKNQFFEQKIQKKEIRINNLEIQNNNLRKDLNNLKEEKRNLKLQYDLLLNNLSKNEGKNSKINLENNKKIENLIIEKSKNGKKIKDLLNIIEEDKNKIKELNEKLSDKKEEILNNINSYKNLEVKLKDKNQECEKLSKSLSKIKEENAIKEKSIIDLKKEIKEFNENMKKEISDKNSTILNLRKSINELNNNIQKLKEENDEIKKEKLELNKKVQEMSDKISVENNNNDIKKENNTLLRTNSQLNEYITELNQKLNSLQIKYQESKKIINEKELKIKDLEDVSKALIEKQKTDLEKKDKADHISPSTHFIVAKKKFNELTWYLVSRLNPADEKKKDYEDFKWVTEKVIPNRQLSKYNKFKEDDSKLNNNSYIKKLYQRLEQKEEEVNKLNYKNKKLNEQLQNKSSSVKNNKLFMNKYMDNTERTGMNKSNSNKNIINTEGNQGSNSLIDKIINYYDNREINYKNEITELENKLKDTEQLQSNVNNIKGISFINQSDFIDDGDYIDQFFKDKNIIKKKSSNSNDLGILKDVPGNESDLDEIKGLQFLIKNLKKDNREKDKKYENLAKKIKELIKKLKYDDKIKPQISQILVMIGFNENDIQSIVNNNNGFFLEKDK